MFSCSLPLFVSVQVSDAYVNVLSIVVFFSLNFSFFDFFFLICVAFFLGFQVLKSSILVSCKIQFRMLNIIWFFWSINYTSVLMMCMNILTFTQWEKTSMAVGQSSASCSLERIWERTVQINDNRVWIETTEIGGEGDNICKEKSKVIWDGLSIRLLIVTAFLATIIILLSNLPYFSNVNKLWLVQNSTFYLPFPT